MGEYAEYMLNGDDCQECGQYIGNGDGYPRSCKSCQGNHPINKKGLTPEQRQKRAEKRRRYRKNKKERKLIHTP